MIAEDKQTGSLCFDWHMQLTNTLLSFVHYKYRNVFSKYVLDLEKFAAN